MSTELAIPKELESMAVSLSSEKKLEIVSAVKTVFENVQKMRIQLEAVNVIDENDKVSMKLANTLRLAMRNERLTAEKFIDSKRETVQVLMSDFKTEDALWLKTKQLMQIETKAFEDLAKYKETTGERILAERKATLEAQRQLEVSKYTEYPAANLSAMGQPVYDAYMDGLILAHNSKIEAEAKAEAERIENKRINDLSFERREQLLPYSDFTANIIDINLFDLGMKTEADFVEIKNKLVAAKQAHEAEQIRIKEENARLQKEAEEKIIRDKKRNEELRPFIIFIRDYSKMINMPEDDYKKEFSDIKIGAEQQWEHERKEQIRLQVEAERKEKELAAEREKVEAELKALEEKSIKEREQAEAILKAEQEKARIEAEAERKKQADILAKQQAEAKRIQDEKDAENARLQALLKSKSDKVAAELKAKQEAEIASKKAAELAAKAPFKEKATKWVESFSIPEFTESSTATDDIKIKFEAYKKWAFGEIAKL